MALVVHVQRAAPIGDGAVVDHGAQRAGHLLADPSAERRDALAVEVGFQAVPHGFMQQDAGPAGPQHHGHLAGGCVHRVQHHDGFACGLRGEMFGRLFVEEEAQFHASAAARMTALRGPAVVASQRGHVQACQRLAVPRKHPVASGHQHLPQIVGIAGLRLEDARVVGARRTVGAFDQFHALGEGRLGGRSQHGIQIAPPAFVERNFLHGSRSRRDARRHARGLANLLRAEVVAVGVAGTLARDHAHTHPQRHALQRALHDGFIDADGTGGKILEVKVGIRAPVRERFSQIILQIPRGNAKALREEGLGKVHTGLG